jgi:hypothetical protein
MNTGAVSVRYGLFHAVYFRVGDPRLRLFCALPGKNGHNLAAPP